MSDNKILLVDDEAEALLSLSRALKTFLPDIEIQGAGTIDKALQMQQGARPKCAVVDLELVKSEGPGSGLRLIENLLNADPDLRIIVLTGHSSIDYGIESIKRGASSFVEKPANVESLSVLINDCVSNYKIRSELRKKANENESVALARLAGKSDATKKLKDEILFAASTNQSIFLSGESGVGKGLCALLIHNLSSRKNKKFIRYQPGFVSGDLVNSDLFGHKKGSFTGADKDRDGLLKDVDGGTLFLDEIDALPVETQVILLGVLQDRKFRTVGGNEDLLCNFRLISASNATMSQAILDNKVRKDFYFRIAHHTITIPALRERIVDIPQLVEAILLGGQERKDYSVFGISQSALLKLKDYSWPGNIRELQAVIEGAAYRAQFASRFHIEDADINLLNNGDNQSDPDENTTLDNFHSKVLAYKKKLIREALAQSGGNQVQAAKLLGLDRSSMRRIIADEL
jgi:DNA-binding NtrC family response regulator